MALAAAAKAVATAEDIEVDAVYGDESDQDVPDDEDAKLAVALSKSTRFNLRYSQYSYC